MSTPPGDLSPETYASLNSAADAAERSFRHHFARVSAPELGSCRVGILPLVVVHNPETGGVRITLGGGMPLLVALEALRLAVDQLDKMTGTSTN